MVGQMLGLHIRDDALTPDRKIDVERLRPFVHSGYQDCTSITEAFEMARGEPGTDLKMSTLVAR